MITLDHGGAARRSIRVLERAGDHRSLVRVVWIDAEPARSNAWRIVADGAPHIVYSRYATAESSVSRLHIVGPRTRFVDIDNTRRLFSIGIRLAPGAVPALARIPSVDITDKTVALDSFLPRATLAHRRMDALDASDTDASIASIISDLAGEVFDPHPRVRILECASSIAQAAQSSGISERAFNNWSRDHLGLGPRRYLRIRRLHCALHLRQSESGLSWSEISARSGYADQSHCVRDFHDLLGESPGAFAARGM